MDVVICGAGEVGRHSAEVLGAEGHNITIIDAQPARIALLEDQIDARTLVGNGIHAEVLRQAGVDSADLFIAATNIDEINLLAASVAKGVGAAKVIARVHHSAYFEQRGFEYGRGLGIDHLVCPDFTTAHTIAQALRSPGALAVEQFARGRIEIQELPVAPDSAAAGKSLTQIKMPPSTRLAAVLREGKSFIPDARTVIQPTDIVTLIGDVAHFDKARKLFHSEAPRRTRVMIVGGTALGVWLCRSLRSRRFGVRLLETDAARCEELAAKLDWVTVLNADPADTSILEEEHVDQVDAFVALTDDDETNILVAARAKSMGADEAIAVLQRPTYLHLLSHVGIDRAFSPRVTAVTEILRLLDDSAVRRLASLAAGIAEVFEINVTPAAQDVVGRRLADIAFPPHCLVAAIQREEDVRVPGAQDTIEPGDTVVVIGPTEAEKPLRKLFHARGSRSAPSAA